jgi:ATP-dependent helicase HrpB
MLQLAAWGETDFRDFPWLDPPSDAALTTARALLTLLGALDQQGVTALGGRMAAVPVSPRLARLVVAGTDLGIPRDAALAAAILSERDPLARQVPRRTSTSDLCDRMEAAHRGGDRWAGVNRVARQIERGARQGDRPPAPAAEDKASALDRALICAFPDRVALRRSPGTARAVMVGPRGVTIPETSAVSGERLFLALQLDSARKGTHTDSLARIAHGIDEGDLPTQTVDVERFDKDRERVTATRRTQYRDLVLAERRLPRPNAGRAASILAEAAVAQMTSLLPMDRPPLGPWIERVRLLAEHVPELQIAPIDPAMVARVLREQCAERTSFAQLRKLDWVEILAKTLDWKQRRALDSDVPETLGVPSGLSVRVDYQSGGPPILAVRIQEMFGALETPTIARGRVPVLLHLLAPNMRPSAVTQDLPNFWREVYPEVRKQLRGRYPKHAWPEDPLSAQPGKRRRR